MRHTGSWIAGLLAVLVGSGLLADPAGAHRVNVFAYVEGDTVHMECSYSKSDRVRFGDIEVSDAATGKVYLTGKTDEKGNFAFAVPPAARAAKADLHILLRAGEGHQNDWTVKAEEYLNAAPATSSAASAPVAEKVDPAVKSEGVDPAVQGVAAKTVAPAPAPSPDMAAMQAAIETAVEAGLEKKIAPLRRMLLDEKEKGPGLTEIFGGIGYLLGIAGLLAYARSRSGQPRS
jgi:nickel transport protein